MRAEAEIASRLDHPSISTYIGLFVEESEASSDLYDFYLVSDYVNGGLAREYLAENRSPEIAEKLVSFNDLGLVAQAQCLFRRSSFAILWMA